MASENILQTIGRELAFAFQPVADAARSSPDGTGLIELIEQLGWDFSRHVSSDDLRRIAADLSEGFTALEDIIADPNRAADVADGLEGFVTATRRLGTLSATDLDTDEMRDEFKKLGERLLDYLLVLYIQRRLPLLYVLLEFVGVVSVRRVHPAPPRLEYVSWEFDWDHLVTLFSAPQDVLRTTYNWGLPSFDAYKLLENLRHIFLFVGVPCGFQVADQDGAGGIDASHSATDPVLRVPIASVAGNGGGGELGLALLPVRTAAADFYEGLGVIPFGSAQLGTTLQLGRGWALEIKVEGDANAPYGLVLRPNGDLRAQRIDTSRTQVPNIGLAFELAKVSQGRPILLIGSESATRVEAASVGASFAAQIRAGSSSEFRLELSIVNGLVVIAGGGDGFLGKVLPPDGAKVNLDLTIGWSTVEGLYFRGSARLEVTIPVHKKIGPLGLESIYLALGVDSDGQLELGTGASITAQIGPVSVAVERVGLETHVRLGSDSRTSFDFLPPTGAGIAVSAGAVTGGGFIKYEPDIGRYSGILNLKFSEIGLVAIGIITTKLPGGKKGFALFINIGVTFSPPITLPYNFNLQGCGGLCAVNRTMDTDALRAGLRNKTLDSILFPEDPILNANKIISDSERVFPIHEGRFVVGPMAKLGWGAKGLITANIAIVLELPAPIVIALLGQVKARVPKDDDAKVRLNLDVLGVLEIEKKSLSFDATLYDSKILVYDLYGDSALRLRWGSDPVFALSIGGFHPRFTPPPSFPSLRRLTLALSSGSSFELSCQVYQALTSNTLQFGASLNAHAEACGVKLDGYLTFDTLFQFSPFEFEVGISGGVGARFHGHHIASVHLSFDLSGPTPWHAKGKAKVSVLCWDATARFNKTWGDDSKASVAKIDPLPLFLAEIKVVGNWNAALSTRRNVVETLKSLDTTLSPPADDTTTTPDPNKPDLLAHPAGSLEFRQRLLPLGLKLDKFKNADVKDHVRFDVTMALGPETAAPTGPPTDAESPCSPGSMPVMITEVKEHFARGQFKDLSKADRLSQPSFERFRAGVQAGPEKARLDGCVQECELEYDSILILPDGARERKPAPRPAWTFLKRTLHVAALRRASLRNQRLGKYGIGGPPRVNVKDEAYSVVDKTTLTRAVQVLPLDAPPINKTQADDLIDGAVAQHLVAPGSVIAVPEFEEVT